MKGLKSTCTMTKTLGRYMGDNVQVFYDAESDTVFGIYHTLNEWSQYRDEHIMYVATYYKAATQREIRSDVEKTISGWSRS